MKRASFEAELDKDNSPLIRKIKVTLDFNNQG